MSTIEQIEPAAPLAPSIERKPGWAPDTLAASVAMLLAMTVVQRLVGFLRGVLFCRWLEPQQLGQWDIAYGFLMLAAPLAVLGLPGSFGRYAEHFRHRGQLSTFLRRITVASAVMTFLALVAVGTMRHKFSQLIFGSPEQIELVGWIGATLATVIVHNFLVSLFIAVRKYRVVTGLQFFQSLLFAVFGVVLVRFWQNTAISVVAAFGLASLISAAGAMVCVKRVWQSSEDQQSRVPQREFWSKLVTFAVWVWITNMLAGAFEVADRYMIIHYSGLPSEEALRQVGYYHSSRLIPLLFVAVAALIGSMVTPYLSHDWETGRRDQVAARLNLALKALLLALFTSGVGVLLVAPWLFEVAFQSKFAGGLAVLPWTLTYCCWFGTFALAQNYLWCAEKARLSSLALFLGLALNITSNWFLLPRFGLHGAVWSTTLANMAALILVYLFSHLSGMRIARGVWLLSAAPASLCLGPIAASLVLLTLLVFCLFTEQVFEADEKRHLTSGVLAYAEKIKYRRHRSALYAKP